MGQVTYKIKEMTVGQLLDLPQFDVMGYRVERRGEQEILRLYCVHQDEVAICPRCREISTTFHDGKKRCVRDLIFGAKARFCASSVGALTVSAVVGLSPKGWPVWTVNAATRGALSSTSTVVV